MSDPKVNRVGKQTRAATHAYADYLPTFLDATIPYTTKIAEEDLRAAQATSPQLSQLQTDIYAQNAPRMADINRQIEIANRTAGAASDVNILKEYGPDNARNALAMDQIMNPQFHQVRELESQRIQELLQPGLTGGEEESINRYLMQANVPRGTNDVPTSTSTVSNAMQFGEAARNRTLQGVGAANSFLPVSGSSFQAGQFALGRDLGANANQFLGVQAPGNQAYESGQALLGMTQDFQTQRNQNQADTRGVGRTIADPFEITGGDGGCCFIFLEAYNGKLPWWVRFCRDAYCTPVRRTGYNRMARWLVPWMRRSGAVSWLVNQLMVLPLTHYGGWRLKVEGYEQGWRNAWITRAWFAIWDRIGGKP